jgi:ribosomal protein S27E
MKALEKPKIVEKDGESFEIKCPQCDGPNMFFDAHVGFASCNDCGFDTKNTGPDICYFKLAMHEERENESKL